MKSCWQAEFCECSRRIQFSKKSREMSSSIPDTVLLYARKERDLSCLSCGSQHQVPLVSFTLAYHHGSTDLGMRCALGIPNDLTNPDTKDSFAEKDAPFVKEVSKGQTFFKYMSDPDNAEMVELANVGVVGWLNVGSPHFLGSLLMSILIVAAIDSTAAPG
jgi:hypothetical protein